MSLRKFPKAGSQRRIILDELISVKGEFVGLNSLMRIACCGAVHSQIDELRKQYGAQIINEQIAQKDGRRHSEYKLINWEEFSENV